LKESAANKYWKSNIRILIVLLGIWFISSFGFGILFSDVLDNFKIGGFKIGFWFAQQGSIYIFVLLIFIYVFLINRLDKKYKKEISEDS
jgi:putative solute:sodium symporter small subunit|tara:strand:- start:254 stop:520 length:267 start_codon:yes stop_codon:yes gene_type:complete